MPAELYTDRARVPDGREEVEGQEIMILFRDAKQVKQGWSNLVDSGRVEEEGEEQGEEEVEACFPDSTVTVLLRGLHQGGRKEREGPGGKHGGEQVWRSRVQPAPLEVQAVY